MISLAIIFGLFFTVFSIQNTQPVAVIFGDFSVPAIPLYVIILLSLLFGVLIAWLFNLIDAVSTFFILSKKENLIRDLKKTVSDLVRKVHELEIEKANKKGKKQIKEEEPEDEDSL